jgi:3-dehydroquinate dehydratase type I
VKYIDFDYHSNNSVPEISDFNAKLSGHLIISYHNFIETPSNEQLNFLIKDIELQKPEIIKICCKVNNINDIIRLLKLYNDYPQLGLIAFDLGENASLTRVLAKLKGAPFIYASIDEENKTEPSQISYDNILKLMEILKND